MTARSQRNDDHRVAAWTDTLSGWIENHPSLWVALGDWETRRLADRLADVSIVKPVYVTGLARAGTTILLEMMSRHPDLATHRYRDFPPVLTPWMWNWFVDRAAGTAHEPRERAHKDRIAITPESPEAFEEVVWMTFFPRVHDPDVSAVLDEYTQNPGFEEFYRDHIRKILLLRGGSRYLAKGNYNVTRLRYILKLFPDARFIVPLRDPVWHIASLMRTHDLFRKQAARDPRAARHLRRTGHFEFGIDRRAINVGDAVAADRIRRLWDEGAEIEGWAEYWSLIYGHLARSLAVSPALRAATRVVWYEDFCAYPGDTLSGLLVHCGLEPRDLPAHAQATISPPRYYEPGFTAAETALIRDRTEGVAKLFPRVASAAA